MSTDIEDEVIQNTQKILAGYIKKPPLTDKLLRKPPFRFLHDIVTNIIKETGFLKGLYSQRELVSENVKDKDDKIAFLNKLIDATSLKITGIGLKVRSSKIIAGLEPTETNLLLQAIGTALEKKLDSSQYVAELKPEKKTKVRTSDKKTKTELSKEKKDNKSANNVTDKNKSTLIPRTKNSTVKVPSDKGKTSKPPSSRDSKEGLEKSKTKTQSKTSKTKLTPKESSREIENTESKEKIDLIPIESKSTTDIQSLKGDEGAEVSSNEGGTPKEEEPKTEALEETEIKIKKDRIKSARPRSSLRVEKPIITETLEASEVEKQNTNETRLNTPQLDENTPLKAEPNLEKPLSLIRPRSSLRPPSVRPSSARPAAPRLRNDIVLPEGEIIPLGKVNVIVENYNSKENDEEETVTIQTIAEPEFQPVPAIQLPTDKGHLVEQILEQIQKDDVIEPIAKPTVDIEWEQDGLRNRNATSKEIEQLKSAIQTLTRTANPLGKLINYLHEDIEAMHTELDMWNNSTRQIMVEIANQKRISDESNKPLQERLKEIEENILNYQQQIVSLMEPSYKMKIV